MDVHRVAVDEVDAATGTIGQAFRGDPVWSVALAVEDRSDAETLIAVVVPAAARSRLGYRGL